MASSSSSSSSSGSSAPGGGGQSKPRYFTIPAEANPFAGFDLNGSLYAKTSHRYYFFLPLAVFRKGASTFREWDDLSRVEVKHAKDQFELWCGIWYIVGLYRDKWPDTCPTRLPHSILTYTAVPGPVNPDLRGRLDPKFDDMDDEKDPEKHERLLEEYAEANYEALERTRQVVGFMFTGTEIKYKDADCKQVVVAPIVAIPGGRGGGGGGGGAVRDGTAKENQRKADVVLERRFTREPDMIVSQRLSAHAIEKMSRAKGEPQKHMARPKADAVRTFFHTMGREAYAQTMNAYTPLGIKDYYDQSAPCDRPVKPGHSRVYSPIGPREVFSLTNATILARRFGADALFHEVGAWDRNGLMAGNHNADLVFPMDGRYTWRMLHGEMDPMHIAEYMFPHCPRPVPNLEDSNFRHLSQRYIDRITDINGDEIIDSEGQTRALHISATAIETGNVGCTLDDFRKRVLETKGEWENARVERPSEEEEKNPYAGMSESEAKAYTERQKNKYLLLDGKLQGVKRAEWQDRMIADFQRCFSEHGEISEPQLAHLKWGSQYLREYGHFSIPWDKQFANLSSLGDIIAFKTMIHDHVFGSYVTQGDALLLEVATITTPIDRKLHLHVLMLGTTAVGKSNLIHVTLEKCIPGTGQKCGTSSSKSEYGSGSKNRWEWAIKTWEEAPPGLFALEQSSQGNRKSSATATSRESAQTGDAAQFREMLSAGEGHHSRLVKNEETGEWDTHHIHVRGHFSAFMALNAVRSEFADNMLTRTAPMTVHMYERPDLSFLEKYTMKGDDVTMKLRKAYCRWFQRDQYLSAFILEMQRDKVFVEWTTKAADSFLFSVLDLAGKSGMTQSMDPRNIERVNIAAIGFALFHVLHRFLDGPQAQMNPKDPWSWSQFKGIEAYLQVRTEHMLAGCTALSAQWEDRGLSSVIKAINTVSRGTTPRHSLSSGDDKCGGCNRLRCDTPDECARAVEIIEYRRRAHVAERSLAEEKRNKGGKGRGGGRGGGGGNSDIRDAFISKNVALAAPLVVTRVNDKVTSYTWMDDLSRGRTPNDDERCRALAQRIIPLMKQRKMALPELHSLLMGWMNQDVDMVVPITETQRQLDLLAATDESERHEVMEKKTMIAKVRILSFIAHGDMPCTEMQISTVFLAQNVEVSILAGCMQKVIDMAGHSNVPYATAETVPEAPYRVKLMYRTPMKLGTRQPYRCKNPSYTNPSMSRMVRRLLESAMAAPARMSDDLDEILRREDQFKHSLEAKIKKCVNDAPWQIIYDDENESTMDTLALQQHLIRCRLFYTNEKCQPWNKDSMSLAHALDCNIADNRNNMRLEFVHDGEPLVYPDALIRIMRQPRNDIERETSETKNPGRYSVSCAIDQMMRLRGARDSSHPVPSGLPPPESKEEKKGGGVDKEPSNRRSRSSVSPPGSPNRGMDETDDVGAGILSRSQSAPAPSHSSSSSSSSSSSLSSLLQDVAALNQPPPPNTRPPPRSILRRPPPVQYASVFPVLRPSAPPLQRPGKRISYEARPVRSQCDADAHESEEDDLYDDPYESEIFDTIRSEQDQYQKPPPSPVSVHGGWRNRDEGDDTDKQDEKRTSPPSLQRSSNNTQSNWGTFDSSKRIRLPDQSATRVQQSEPEEPSMGLGLGDLF